MDTKRKYSSYPQGVHNLIGKEKVITRGIAENWDKEFIEETYEQTKKIAGQVTKTNNSHYPEENELYGTSWTPENKQWFLMNLTKSVFYSFSMT